MEIKAIFFYMFAAIMLFSAFRVISARNPVHAVLYMMLAFIQMSGIWLLLQAEFLAVILVIVYLGAVIVLFLFVVMMINIDFAELRQGFWRHAPLAALLGAVVAVQMVAVLLVEFGDRVEIPKLHTPGLAEQSSDVKQLGYVLYSEYLYPIQIAAIILLVGMVAAISLTLYRRKNTRYVDPQQQVKANPAQRLQLVKVAVTRPAPPAEQEEQEC